MARPKKELVELFNEMFPECLNVKWKRFDSNWKAVFSIGDNYSEAIFNTLGSLNKLVTIYSKVPKEFAVLLPATHDIKYVRDLTEVKRMEGEVTYFFSYEKHGDALSYKVRKGSGLVRM